ncbi:MAG TPA: putative Na+/H+ antiporter [Candidatus Limnocylindrales bacterium]|nr:putative Na+/H+ antiporter [Candidatus Limnocylindrales bacterium]
MSPAHYAQPMVFGLKPNRASGRFFRLVPLLLLASALCVSAASEVRTNELTFPPPLASYGDAQLPDILDVLKNRVHKEPFNLWATIIFLLAIIHTFLTHKFVRWSHLVEKRHRERLAQQQNQASPLPGGSTQEPTCAAAVVLHFLGEVEAVFGIWVIPLFILMTVRLGWHRAVNYLDNPTAYIEPIFVVVIMAISSTRPVLRLAEHCLGWLARLGGGGPGAWWMAILTAGPVLGSVITEPAAMTISALLLRRQFYELKPAPRLAYATLGLLFVNISVGGVLTHFAAPPVLMVASRWGWNTPFMFRQFGEAALAGIVISNIIYYLAFRRSIAQLASQQLTFTTSETKESQTPIPAWVTIGNLIVMAWTVLVSHYPVLVVGGFLFFVAFVEVTSDYQSELQLRSPILVGFFLAGLVIHGGLQQWWIGPVLSRLGEQTLMFGALVLTAFNDNAAITYLATLVPDLSEGMKFAVVAGAVTGGGLTVIANAPNPAGQSLLSCYFPDGIAPLGLLLGALPATLVMLLCFLVIG